MAASVTDKFKKYSDGSQPPAVATVSSPRSTGATTLATSGLSGWTTDTAVDFITYRLDTANVLVPGSITYWVGIVSGSNLTNVARVKGAADGGNSINDIVKQIPDSDRFDDLVDGILTHTDQDGTLKSGAVDTSAVLANNVVTTTKINDGAVTNAKLATTTGELGAAWQTYTPTFTNLSGGTLNYFKYIQIGKTVYWRMKYTMAGANVTGQVSFTLPVAHATDYDSRHILGIGVASTSAGGFNKISAGPNGSGPLIVWADNASGTYVQYTATSSTVPITWASGSILALSGEYEVA